MHPSGAPVTKSHSSVPSGGTGVLRPPLPPAPTMLAAAGTLGGTNYRGGGGGIFCGVEFLLNKFCAKFLCAICSVFLRICTAIH